MKVPPIGVLSVNVNNMETKVVKVVVKSVENVADESINSLQINCESVTDFANMSVTDILASGGVRKYVFFLRNCKDKKDILEKALINKETFVCVYTIPVCTLCDATSVNVIDDGEVIGTYTSLTYSVPCKDDFVPSEKDCDNVVEQLKAQVTRRISNGSYELA